MRREQIAAAALSLIGQAGLEGLSIVGIATEVGLVPSAIYRHFSGKAAIIDAVNELISERLLGIVRHVCDEETDPIAQLRMLLTLHINLIKTNNGIPRYIFSSEVATDSSGRNHQLYTTVQRYLEKVAAIIRVGQHTGRIRPELEANILAYMFLGLLQPAIFLNHLSDGQFDIETETQRAWQVFSQSILATAD
ncbi:MAG: TetR/AcrR family transcriptional regulator [Desulfuromonas sp.]|nr:TetR/AcrR family transcriptional regulator [Desulfuromonas sp.]